MNNRKEEIDKIYQEIVDLIWSIFPNDGIEAYFNAQIFEDSNERNFYWLDSNGDKVWNELGKNPSVVLRQISEELKKLQNHKLFEKEKWTHCKVTVCNEGKLNIKFAYIPQENSWPGVYMKGVSELSYEEAEKHYVDTDEWKRLCVKFKK